jgi:large conductance mechanosensitive channel
MGAAFTKVVSSFTGGIVSPVISLMTGGVDFSKKSTVIRQSTEVKDADGVVTSGLPELSIQWGAFLTNVIDFIIVAFFMFLIIKAINSMKKKEEAPAPAGPSSTDQLLMEIRDALKK